MGEEKASDVERKYEADFAILDRYQGFSGEIVRISLVILGALGLALVADKQGSLLHSVGPKFLKDLPLHAMEGCAFFCALATVFALRHRYISADAMTTLIQRDRESQKDLDIGKRTRQLDHCLSQSSIAIACASASLIVAVACFATGFIAAMN